MIDLIQVGRKINRLRSDSGLSQDDLAESLFVTRQAISKWENGLAAPSVDSLLALCEKFDVSFDFLLGLHDNPVVLTKKDLLTRDKMTTVKGILKGEFTVSLPEVFDVFSKNERLLLLKAVQCGKYACNIADLWQKLTDDEKTFLTRKSLKRGVK